MQTASLYPKKRAALVLGQRAIPIPTADQIQIRIESAALNPVDWKIPARGFHVSIYPAVLGSDIAGIVSAIGPDVKNFEVGDRAMCQGGMLNPDECAFQQYMVVSSTIACKIPENISNDEASTVCVASIAALVSLVFHETGLAISPPFWPGVPSRKRSDMILIMGGSTSVGQYCIQFCVLAGFKRILTTCSPKNADLVKAAGATHVFDRDAEDLNAQIREITGDDLIYAVDSAAADDTQIQSYTALSDTKPGVCAILLHSVLPGRTRPTKPFGTRQTWKIDGFANVWTELSEEYFKVLPEWLENGAVKPMRHQFLPGGLAAIPTGSKVLMDNEVSGAKLVIHPQEGL